jgi:hypothetical protein
LRRTTPSAVQKSTKPRLRHRQGSERNRVPFMTDGNRLAPRHHNTHNAERAAYGAKHEHVQHGPVRCKLGREIAARDAVDSAIGSRKKEKGVAHGLARRWKNTGCLQQLVGAESNDATRDCPREHGPDAATNLSRMLSFVHD